MRPTACLIVTLVASSLAIACAESSPPAPVVAPILPAPSEPVAISPVEAHGSGPVARAAALAPLRTRFRDALAGGVPRTGTPDSLLYLDAHERAAHDDPTVARKTLLELIMRHPQSPLVPYAYLAFGDLFFAEAEDDDRSKYPLALQAYDEVLKHPPPVNEAYAYALHQRGVVLARTGDAMKALDAQKKALAAIAAHPRLPLAEEVATAARRELVVTYATVGDPRKAIPFFRTIDAAATPSLVLALGDEYVRRSAVPETISLYESAFAVEKTDALCRAASAAMKTFAVNAALDAEVAKLVARYETQLRAKCP